MEIKRLAKEIIEEYKKMDTSSITDALDKQGIAGGLLGVKAVVEGTTLCGQAFTVHYVPCGQVKGTVGDFLDDVAAGDVVVIDNSGRDYCTVWGDIMSQVAKAGNVAGTVIDGVCRDVKIVRDIKYPIFSKGIYIMTGKDRVEVDAVNIPIGVSGVKVCTGDLILADHFEKLMPSNVRLGQLKFMERENKPALINVAMGNVSLPMNPAMQRRMFELNAQDSPFAEGVVQYSATVGLPEAVEAFKNILRCEGFDTSNLYIQVTDGGSFAAELFELGVCGDAGTGDGPFMMLDPSYTNHGLVARRLKGLGVALLGVLFSFTSMSIFACLE